jgi:outer membrane protein
MRSMLLVLISLTFSLASHADDLLSLYQHALLASPELSGSQYALDITRAQEDQSFGKLLPQASLRGNYSGNQLKRETFKGSGYPGTSASINVRQPLFDLQAYLLMKSQQSLTARSEENLLAAHQQLIFDLVDRYVDALEASDKTEIISTELSSTEKQLARVKAMSERQMALVTDLYQLQAKVETLRSDLIVSQNDAHIALEKLRELTGEAVTGIQPVRLDTEQPAPEGNVDTWIEQISRNNPDIGALKHAVESADQSISAYQAGHLPRVELQASGSYSNTTYNNQQSPPYEVGTIGVEAMVPLYEGGITSARVREAEGRKGLGTSQLEQKKREMEKITRNAYLDMTISQARSQATDRALEASIKAKLAMEKGYELGVVTIIDLLNAQKQLSDARKNQRESRYRYFKTRTALLQQAGRLDVEELAKLNSWLIADSTLAATNESVIAVDNSQKTTKPAQNVVAKPTKTEPTLSFSAPSKPAANIPNIASTANKPTPTVETQPSDIVTNATKVGSPISFSAPSKPAANKPVIDNTANKPTTTVEIQPSEIDSQPIPENTDNIVLDEKTTERAAVNAKVQTFVHADFKPVIKSVTNPYKTANKPVVNPNYKPVFKPIANHD